MAEIRFAHQKRRGFPADERGSALIGGTSDSPFFEGQIGTYPG
jgi:hypothetical protein